jgi:hypothetical protein
VVETSAGNFQAWLKHAIVFPKLIGAFVAQTLAGRYDADPSAADWRRFGRLPGFTNCKPKYRKADSLFLSFGSAATPGSNTPLPRHSSGRSPSSTRHESRSKKHDGYRVLFVPIVAEDAGVPFRTAQLCLAVTPNREQTFTPHSAAPTYSPTLHAYTA